MTIITIARCHCRYTHTGRIPDGHSILDPTIPITVGHVIPADLIRHRWLHLRAPVASCIRQVMSHQGAITDRQVPRRADRDKTPVIVPPVFLPPVHFRHDRVMAGRVMAGRVMADRAMADRAMADQVAADRVMADRIAPNRAPIRLRWTDNLIRRRNRAEGRA